MQSEEAEAAGEASESEEPSCAEAAPGAAKKKKKQKKRKPAAAATLPSFERNKAHLPWTIQAVPSRGRCAIATRDIAAGELVLLERAIAFAPRDCFAHAVCHHCLADLPTHRVGASAFCSAACSTAAGSAHDALLTLSAAVAGASAASGVDGELLRLVCALALARDAPGGEHLGQAVVRGTRDDVAALVAPPADAAVLAACEALLARAPCAVSVELGDAPSLARLAATVNCNAHGLGAMRAAGGTNSTDVAAGLFPFLSMLNHSCAPNAAFTAAAPGGVMAVRALAPVLRGEELTVSYLNLYESRDARRSAALATKGFTCACARCVQPLAESFDRRLQGAQCRCGDVFVAEQGAGGTDWACAACGKRDGGIGAAAASAAATALDEAMTVYRSRGHAAAEPLLQALLAQHGAVLSPHHVTLFDARTPLMNCARARGDAAAAITHCSAVIESLQAALGPSSAAEASDFLACLGDLHAQRAEGAPAPLAKAQRAKAKDAYGRAAALRALFLGAEHPATVAMAERARGDGARRRA